MGGCWFWGGLIPSNISDLKPLIRMGVRGFKAFLIESGVDEFPAIESKHILAAMKEVKDEKTMLMFHAEMQPPESAATVSFSIPEDDDEEEEDINEEDITKFSSSADTLTADIEDFNLGMSASFINRAPPPVVKLLANDQGDHHEEHENCRLPHNHAGSMNHSVLTDQQARALAHTPILAGAEPTYGKHARKVNHHHQSPYYFAEEDTKVSTPLLLAQEEDSTLKNIDATSYASFLASRPDNFETTAIAEIINCSTLLPSVPLHIVHLATHEAIPLLRAAKARGLPISAETCFHYLSLCAERIGNCSTHFKCCPPIRTDDNRKLLWRALRNDIITTVVSDHSPCTPDLKGFGKG